jgi:hypothetical protein
MKHENDAKLSKGGNAKMTAENTNMHKLMKMGQHPKFEVSGGKKTPA